jgi:hypothetical protein
MSLPEPAFWVKQKRIRRCFKIELLKHELQRSKVSYEVTNAKPEWLHEVNKACARTRTEPRYALSVRLHATRKDEN